MSKKVLILSGSWGRSQKTGRYFRTMTACLKYSAWFRQTLQETGPADAGTLARFILSLIFSLPTDCRSSRNSQPCKGWNERLPRQPPLTCFVFSAIMQIWRASRFSPFTLFIISLFYAVFWTLHIIWIRTEAGGVNRPFSSALKRALGEVKGGWKLSVHAPPV